jgi:hypothetical protein
VVFRINFVARQDYALPGAAHQFAQAKVVSDMVGDRLQPADRLQCVAPQAQGLTGSILPVTEEPGH